MPDSYTIEGIGRKIDDFQRDVDSRFDALPDKYATKEALGSVTKELGKKVNITWFMATQLSLLVFIAGILFSMYSSIASIKDTTQVTREAVANIQGKLEPFDFAVEK